MMRRKVPMSTPSLPDTSSTIIARSSEERRICDGGRGDDRGSGGGFRILRCHVAASTHKGDKGAAPRDDIIAYQAGSVMIYANYPMLHYGALHWNGVREIFRFRLWN